MTTRQSGQQLRRIAVVNCNTSTRMTRKIAEGARRAASTGTEIVAMQPAWGPSAAEGFYDSFQTAAAVLECLRDMTAEVDAVVMAGFGEHGREGARDLLSVPVVDITEAAVMQAMLIGHRYGIVTTVPRAVGLIEDSLLTAGLLQRCAAIEATGLGVLEVGVDHDQTVAAFIRAGGRAISAGADVLVLGCAGFTAVEAALSDALNIAVVDAVGAGVVIAESLLQGGIRLAAARGYGGTVFSRRGRFAVRMPDQTPGEQP